MVLVRWSKRSVRALAEAGPALAERARLFDGAGPSRFVKMPAKTIPARTFLAASATPGPGSSDQALTLTGLDWRWHKVARLDAAGECPVWRQKIHDGAPPGSIARPVSDGGAVEGEGQLVASRTWPRPAASSKLRGRCPVGSRGPEGRELR